MYDQFAVSEDIVAIAKTVAATGSDELQIARTNWFLGEIGFEEFLPDLSTAFVTKAADVYYATEEAAGLATQAQPRIAALLQGLGHPLTMPMFASCSTSPEPAAR